MLYGLNIWRSINDGRGQEDIKEQTFEGTERQANLKDADRADPRSNGTKGRKEVYANRSISWQREIFLSAETSQKDTVCIALALYSQTGQEAGACPGRECSSQRDCHHRPGMGAGAALAWLGAAFPGVDGKLCPLCTAERLCTAEAPELLMYVCMDMANIPCGILEGEIFFSLCSEVSCVIGVSAGGTGRMYVLNSPIRPGAFGSAAGVKWWRTAGKDLGIFQAARVLAVFVARGAHCCSQGCALLQAIGSEPGFQRKLVLGRGWALLILFAAPEGLSPWSGLHSPACVPCIADIRWKRPVYFQLR